MGASRGLSGMPDADLQRYHARLVELWCVAEQMRLTGEMLAEMGPLAPPCLALPYMTMRGVAQDATDALLTEVRARGSEDDYRRFEMVCGGALLPDPKRRPAKPIAAIMSLPGLKAFWANAPSKWRGLTTIPGGTSQGGLGDTATVPRPPSPTPWKV